MDVLTDVLNTLELKGWLQAGMEMTPPWRVNFLASHDSLFHLFRSGGGYLSVEGEATPLRIESGDVVVFPFGHAHSIYDDHSSPLTKTVQLAYSTQCEYQRFPSEGERQKMVMLCGAFHLESPSASLLLQGLPKVLHIPGKQGRMAQGFSEIVRLIARESAEPLVGAEAVLRRLTELLFIHVIRVWIGQQAQASTGWVAALRDQPIRTALGLIHQYPEHGWKVEELASSVALSRSAFSARFTQVMGEPPIKYLTRWRMHRATRLLKNDVKVETIARLLGYESEVAFRQAFKREVGMPPARYRKLGEPASAVEPSHIPLQRNALDERKH